MIKVVIFDSPAGCSARVHTKEKYFLVNRKEDVDVLLETYRDGGVPYKIENTSKYRFIPYS